ncbi:anaerobic sulfatase maturase [Azoarcus communis]|uniref:Anaerobic sulfatase maturase n=1 Tax=Parazoarcus communis SWub3 = DSM 12120 TaxID=1121029 RepID=A0A323V0I1_9RHOO|nr:anaerobic sulfatase maturase [Parazoarcus communis SWub3 = DSM 12120]PZA18001.1 anaerobic sulfatase maturase [Azoarcus communis] [Parazoarcus communis SWub3 = DSM 12120]
MSLCATVPKTPECTLPALPPGRHYRYHVMVKPAGALCNLDCPYCFYLHKTDLLQHGRNARMDDSLLETHIRQYIEAQTGDEVVFSWQGGEPTVMGLGFFRRVVELQARHRKPGQRIENDLQTNGLLLDDAWVAFLKAHRFVVGLSVDGTRELHDRYRPTKGGEPTYDRVIAAANRLAVAEVPFSLLCVVNLDVARAPREVYRSLRAIPGSFRIQFTPCVETRDFRLRAPGLARPADMPLLGTPRTRPDHPLSIVTDWSVDARDYGDFLCAIWQEWLVHDFGRLHINVFETAVAQSLGLPAQMCTSAPVCGKAMALEHDGELYACDHFVYPAYRLGNIREIHQGDLAFADKQVRFGLAKHDSLPGHCRRCPSLPLCWGECPKNRLLRTPDGEPGLNYLCEGLATFYARVTRDMPEIRHRLGVRTPGPIIQN